MNLDRVAVSRDDVEAVIICVQDFVGDASFMQRSFFSSSGVAMLKDAAAAADSIIVSEENKPCSVLGDGRNQHVVSELQSCQEKVVLRRKASWDTSERWFGAPSAASPSARTFAGQTGLRLSNIVAEGQVEYVAVLEPAASSSRSVKSTVIGSKRKASLSSGPMSQKHFDVVSPVTSHRKSYVDASSFDAALDCEVFGSRRRSGPDRRAPPIFEFAKNKWS